jgi:hypothetical protein
MEAAARPKPVWGAPTKITPLQRAEIEVYAKNVYYENRRTDEWPGEAYDGSSVAAAMATGKRHSWWDAYVWASTTSPATAAQEVCLALGQGPVVMGSDWLSGMEADDTGFFRISGTLLGGHCYLLTSYNRKSDSVWTPNSWGGAGQGRISRAGLVTLFERGADAAFPVHRNLVARG